LFGWGAVDLTAVTQLWTDAKRKDNTTYSEASENVNNADTLVMGQFGFLKVVFARKRKQRMNL